MTDLDLTDPAAREAVNAAVAKAMGWFGERMAGGDVWRRRRADGRDGLRYTTPNFLGGDFNEEMIDALRREGDVRAFDIGFADAEPTVCIDLCLKGEDGGDDVEVTVEGATLAEALVRALLAAEVATLEESQ